MFQAFNRFLTSKFVMPLLLCRFAVLELYLFVLKEEHEQSYFPFHLAGPEQKITYFPFAMLNLRNVISKVSDRCLRTWPCSDYSRVLIGWKHSWVQKHLFSCNETPFATKVLYKPFLNLQNTAFQLTFRGPISKTIHPINTKVCAELAKHLNPKTVPPVFCFSFLFKKDLA